MKKKTALTLSTAALLSAGLLFGAKFYKQKKERDEFEEQLKTVLVPDAEKKLDDLLRKDAALNDSVIKFEEALNLLKQKEDSLHAIIEPSTHEWIAKGVHGDGSLVGDLIGPFKELRDLGEDLFSQWDNKVLDVFYDGFGDYQVELVGNWYGGVDYQSKDKKTIALCKKAYYLMGNMTTKYPEVPAHGAKYMLRDSLPMPKVDYDAFNRYDRLAMEFYYNGRDVIMTRDLYGFFETMRYATSSISKTDWFLPGTMAVYVYYNHTPGLRLQILKSWQAFLKSIDNSQKVFNQKTLDALDKKVKELMPIVEKEYQLWSQRIEKGKKLESFRGAKDAVGKQIKQQKEKVNVLKTTPVEVLMRRQRGK